MTGPPQLRARGLRHRSVAATDHRSQAGRVDETVRVDDARELFGGEDVSSCLLAATASRVGAL